MIYYRVEEITPDDYVSVLNFRIRDNAQKYIDDHPNLNLNGPDLVDTEQIYFED